jgi:hypothetical protein
MFDGLAMRGPALAVFWRCAFNSFEVLLPGLTDFQVANMAEMHFMRPPMFTCSLEKELDHKQWSSGQIMWVDREKRRE